MIRLNCDYLEGCHPAILERSRKPTWSKPSAMAWTRIVSTQPR